MSEIVSKAYDQLFIAALIIGAVFLIARWDQRRKRASQESFQRDREHGVKHETISSNLDIMRSELRRLQREVDEVGQRLDDLEGR